MKPILRRERLGPKTKQILVEESDKGPNEANTSKRVTRAQNEADSSKTVDRAQNEADTSKSDQGPKGNRYFKKE